MTHTLTHTFTHMYSQTHTHTLRHMLSHSHTHTGALGSSVLLRFTNLGEVTGFCGKAKMYSLVTEKCKKTFCYRNRKLNVNSFLKRGKVISQRSQSE